MFGKLYYLRCGIEKNCFGSLKFDPLNAANIKIDTSSYIKLTKTLCPQGITKIIKKFNPWTLVKIPVEACIKK